MMADLTEESVKPRQIVYELGILTQTDGSALLCQGSTAALVGVYGPIEVKLQKMLIDKANIEVYFRPKAGLPGIADRVPESIIKNTCETALLSVLYPRSSVVIVIQEMQNFGGFLACAINAVCLALLHSGISMRFLIGAVSCALDDAGKLHLDPDEIIVKHSNATFVFVFDNVDKHIVVSHTSGVFSFSQYKNALQLCKTYSENIFNFYHNAINNKSVH